MNEYSLLYYPDFCPNPVWLRKVLLLADTVTRIVPNDVIVHDPESLRELQETIPNCLRAISPQRRDICIEEGNLPRLEKAFAFLKQFEGKRRKKKIFIHISPNGSMSIGGHVFLHAGKLSPVIHHQLKRHGLILEGFGQNDFLAVHKGASHIILSAIAENISRRLGFDTITDKPIPFALNALNGLNANNEATVEGILLSSFAKVLIPSNVSNLENHKYRILRESYIQIRGAFRELTVELARINRLGRVNDQKVLKEHIQIVVADFVKQYQEFRNTKYARTFKTWTPMYVGGLLSAASAFVHPPIAAGIATASLVIQVVQKKFDRPLDQPKQQIFNMLATLQKDIVKQSGVTKLV